MLSKLLQNDTRILYAIKRHIRKPKRNKTMVTATKLGNGGMIWLGIGGLLMLSKKYRKCGFVLTSTVLINSFTVNFVFKNIIRRPRPFVTYPEEKLITKKPVGYSFPSGHAVTSFAAATILTANNPIFGLATIPLATLISFTRMYLFVHYPSDVACGILIGIGTGATAYNLQKKAYSK